MNLECVFLVVLESLFLDIESLRPSTQFLEVKACFPKTQLAKMYANRGGCREPLRAGISCDS